MIFYSNQTNMKILMLSVLFSVFNNLVFSQDHVDFLKSQTPERFELYDKLKYFQSLNCDSLVGSFCTSKSFDHLTDKNVLTDRNNIGLKYLSDDALADSVYYKGLLCVGLVKVIDNYGIRKIINYNNGPLNRIVYEYDSQGLLKYETHYLNGELYIEREFGNGKLICQWVMPLIFGTFESFCIEDGNFTNYTIFVQNDTLFLSKKYDFTGPEIKKFKISYTGKIGCKEILEVDYFPGFVVSRSEYITDCGVQVNSFEANYFLNRKVQSSGRYIYPITNVKYEKTNRTKIGEWKFYDLNSVVKKIVRYDDNGDFIDCKGECD